MGKEFFILLALAVVMHSALAGLSRNDYDNRYKISEERYEELMQEEHQGNQKIIHIVPHTHDDAGWLKTVDEYYSGDKDDIALAGVEYILDGIYDTLIKNPDRKFTYVEMVFFTKWWNEQTQEVKENVKMMVEQGRLAFVNGGWTMSDEANVNYEDFINNMKAGHDFLKETFDFKPTIGWHVDPFGHQSATAALFAEMGFDAWFFARGDYQDKEIRMEDKSLEFLWRPFYENLGNRTEIFTHWMFDMYFSPANFTFEELWGNSPIVDDPNLRTYNLDERLEEFELLMRDRASHYKTDHILAVFGQDFAYLNAQKSFKNIDKLIYHFNKKYSHMKLVYSTPYDYVKAVHESKVKLPVQYDDMLPYASSPHDYWTGYYTSRANFKSLVKYSSEKFNSYSTLFAEDSLIDHSEEEEIQLMDTYTEFYHKMGLVQHHDAVAGTAKKRVMDDYSDQLYYSVKGATGQIFKTFGNLHDLDPRDFSMCIERNSSLPDCPTNYFDKYDTLDLYITSPVRDMTMMPRIPLPDGNFTFEWDGGQPDITCDGPMTTYAFLPVDIKRGETIQIRIHRDTVSHCVDLLDPYTPIEMEHISVSYLGENEAGESQFSYHNKDTGVSEKISTSLMAYDSFQNTSEHVSGAYIFRPEHEDGQAYSFRNEITKRELFCGKNVCILLMFGDTVINNIIFNNFNDFIRLETVFMGIPYSEQGKEVVMRIRAESIQNDGVFYTDSMGLELQKRVVNERPYWNLDVNEPVAGNYYPVNNLIRITDNNTALEVINDRPQGGTSLKDGEIELMVQRRLYVDDEKGVNEPLNESDDGTPEGPGAKVKLYTYFRITTPNPPEPISIAKVDLESPAVEIFDFSPSEEPPRRFSSTKCSYPRELKILSFPEGNGIVFFRIENILEKKIRDETFTVDATKIAQELSNLEIDSLVETSLTGVFTIDELQSRLKWEGEDFTSPRTDYSSDLSNITLEPQRIRSFRVKFKKPSVVSFSS